MTTFAHKPPLHTTLTARTTHTRRAWLSQATTGMALGVAGGLGLGAFGLGRDAWAQGGEIAQVVNWIDGGELLLAHGERIVLQDVYLPTTTAIPSQAGRGRAISVLSSLLTQVVGRNVQVFPETTVVTNNIRRKFAHIFLEGGVWLQGSLVTRGVAWVLPHQGSRARILPLYEAEYDARNARAGLWGTGDFKVYDVNDPTLGVGRNVIMFGRIAALTRNAADLVITFVSTADAKAKTTAPPLPYVLVNRNVAEAISQVSSVLQEGQLIRVRGWLSAVGGKRMSVLNSAQIEAIGA